MIVSDVGKLGLIIVFLVGLFVLVLTGTITFGEAAPYLTLIAGFLFGNGASVVRREAPSPVLVSRVHGDEVLTVSGSYPATREGNNDHGSEA